MRVGVQLFATCRDDRQPADALRETVQLAVTADRLGFDTVWFAEHHGTQWNSCSDPLALAAHVAAKTSRITLGTAVVNLTLHHPRAIAERTWLVQALSDDRLTLGIGRGFSTLDYQTFDIPTVQAADTFTANHQRLRAELAGGSAPIPPIWLATTGARPSLRMAAEHRYGLLLAGNGAKLSAAVADFRDEWHRLHDDEPQIALFRAVHIADTRKRAHSEIADHAAWYVNQMSRLQPGQPSPTLAEVVSTFCILGSPAECIDTIQALHAETGLTELACVFGIGGAPASLALTAMERFAEEVAPNLAAMP